MPENAELVETRRRFLAGLRVAVVVIAFAVLATAALFRNLASYKALWVQLVAFGILFAVVAIELVFILRKRVWGTERWGVLALAFATSLASALTLPDAGQTGALDWCYGTMGWIGVILFLDRPARCLLTFLAAHEMLTIAMVAVSGGTGAAFLNAATAAIGGIGLPLAGGVAATALRDIAADAHRIAEESEHLSTAEAVDSARHARRKEQFANLDTTSMPLLRGLADGTLDPEDPAVARACAIEAARMRRLFAELDDVPDPLRHELNHCADIADRRGVVVDFETHGSWPELPPQVRRALTDAPLAALATAREWARITVVGAGDLVSVDVIADCGPVQVPAEASDAVVTVESVTEGDVLWIRTRWQKDG